MGIAVKGAGENFSAPSEIEFTVVGEPASKANSRRIIPIKGRFRSIKSKKALDYTAVFRQQCPKLDIMFRTDVGVDIQIYYKTRRPDLDESVILDAMQGLIYDNDRMVREKHIYWRLDKLCPRARIRVYALASRGMASRN